MINVYDFFKVIAFRFDPELMHNVAIGTFETFPQLAAIWNFKINEGKYSLVVNGNEWKFPVGLAAGFDENARAVDFFTRLNFGAVEVGTITPKFQIGNDKPRLWRYVDDESLRNSMGFNNLGADLVYEKIKNVRKNGKILGVNMGKNKITPEEKAPENYRFLYEKFAQLSDYLVINVSSPNTPGLRELQKSEQMERILQALEEPRKNVSKPLYLKVSPDSELDDLKETIELTKKYALSGIIATNTTIMTERGKGGVSGKLLAEKARNIRRFILDCTREVPHMEVIGVGGISSFDDVWDFWKNGGKVVQIYTSFVYQGPDTLSRIRNEIDRVMTLNRVETLQELIDNIGEAKR